MNHIQKTLIRTILALSLFICALTLISQNPQSGTDQTHFTIGITTGSFIPEKALPDDFTVIQPDLFQGKYFRVLQFYQIPSEALRQTWNKQGLVLLDYLPGNVYFASIEERFDLQNLQNQVRAILEIDSRFKVEAPVFFNGIPDHAKRNGLAKLTISYFATVASDRVMNDLRLKGVEIEGHRSYSLQIDVSIVASRLEEITALPYIQFIGTRGEEPVLEGVDYRNSTSRSNYLNTGYNGLNYNGAGMVIGIGEGGTADNLIDIKGRLTEMVTGVPSNHKIIVMKNAGGGGNLDPADRNNAWGADMLSVEDFPDYTALYSSHNLRYTNHSYGFSISGGYDQNARDHDLRIASLPNHLVIYSAGNSGDQTGYAPYSFDNWANITGQLKQNKNMFAIGNLAANDELIYYSSRGPMYDGRIIPQLALAGFEGTSYSAPKVTGQMAMLAQIYKEKNSGNEPPSSLLRTIILNTADDLGNPGPDFKHGYGRPNMRRAYHMINDSRFLTSSVAHGNTNTHNITVPANTKQVRVMIVWPDVAAAVNANPAIVNNLNMQATDPSSNTYNPWVLDHTANPTNLDLPATRGVDNINTIEQVTVDDPAAGAWSISVNGANVPTGPQTYYLTYEFLMDELHMAFPLENHKFIPGETYYLRWDSYGGTGTFSLDYRLAGGSWTSIVTGYDANSRVYTWIAPTVSSIQTIEFRVQRGSLTSASGVNYIGGVPENFRIFKVCSDEVTLKWSPVSGANSYKVYRLEAQYMEEVTSNITFTGTTAVLTGQSAVSTEYYAVSALTGTNEGQRSNALEKAPGDYGCVAISWTGTVSTDWFDGGNWSSGVPTCADNIIIPSAPGNQPLIDATGAECGTITIESGASLTMSGSTAYTLSVCGDWINNGTFTHGIGTVNFNGSNTYQEIAGSSATDFYILRVEKGAMANTLEANSIITLNATAPDARLQLISGTFKLSNSASNIIAINTNGQASANALGSGKRIWVHDGTLAVNSSWRLNQGELRITGGLVNVGNANSQHIDFLNNGKIILQGGELNVSAGIWGNSTTSTGTVIINGGTLTLAALWNGFTRPAFEMNSNTTFTMTGGTIVVRRHGTSGAGSDYFNHSNNTNVTGGTLQIGNSTTPASQTIRINSTVPIYNLLLSAHNSPTAQLVTNDLTVSNDVTLAGGALDLNSLNLNVGGDWINDGHPAAIGGTVVFNGSAAQTIGGSLATTFTNLTINGTDVELGPTYSSMLTVVNSALTINSGKKLTVPAEQRLTVNGTLTNNAGNDGLVIKSDATGTGSLLHNTPDVTASVERHTNTDKWHTFSSAVQDATSGIFYFPGSGFNVYLMEHDEATNNYSYISEANAPLPPYHGLFIWGTGASLTEKTYLMSGTLNEGALGALNGLTRTDANTGWNFLGNPYPSALDWYSAYQSATTDNIDATVYVYNHPQWATWNVNSGGVNGGSRYIASGQGFFVRVTGIGTGTLILNNNDRLHQDAPYLKSEITDIVKLRISDDTYTDEASVLFRKDATWGFDALYDAYKIISPIEGVPQIYTYTDEKYAINVLPEIQPVPVHISAEPGKILTIDMIENNYFDQVFLEDLLTGEMTDLLMSSYSFTYDVINPEARFLLHFGPLSLTGNEEQPVNIWAYGKEVIVAIPGNDIKGRIIVYDILGKEVFSKPVRSNYNKFRVESTGSYIVNLTTIDQVTVKKIFIR